MKIKKLTIKKTTPSDNIGTVLVGMANEMVVMKETINQLIDTINDLQHNGGDENLEKKISKTKIK